MGQAMQGMGVHRNLWPSEMLASFPIQNETLRPRDSPQQEHAAKPFALVQERGFPSDVLQVWVLYCQASPKQSGFKMEKS